MPLHLIFLFRSRPDMSRARFLEHWAVRHAPLVAALPQVRAYVRNVIAPVAAPSQPWQGVEELWVDDERAADELFASEAWRRGPLADESNFVDTKAVLRLRVSDHAVIAGVPIARDETLPKRMTFFRHKPGTTRGEALHYWRHQHGPLAASAPGVRRYVQSTVAADEANGSPFDGVAQIWLESDAALGALAASALFRERIKPDEANFVAVEHNLTLAVHEQREVWPAQAGAIACANVDAAQMRRGAGSEE